MNLNWLELNDSEKYKLVWGCYDKLATTKKPRPSEVERALRQECVGVPSAINSFNSTVRLYADATYGKELIDVTDDFGFEFEKNFKIVSNDAEYHDGEKLIAPLILYVDGVVRRIWKIGSSVTIAKSQLKTCICYMRNRTPMKKELV